MVALRCKGRHYDQSSRVPGESFRQTLLAALGVVKSHSRPHVSNDNAFSESQFKTLKYRPEFPDRFGSQEDARGFCERFVRWYNHEHYHSGLGLLTPAMVHYGRAREILASRQQTLDAAFAARPERFVRKRPEPMALPEAVWINPPKENDASDDHRSSRDDEKKLPAVVGGKPDAPSAHPRPGYPLPSCVPAELDSVSRGPVILAATAPYEKAPSDTRAMPKKIPGAWGLAPTLEESCSRSESKLH